MKDRRKFLKNAGSSALFATLGSSFFISCDDTSETVTPPPNNNNNESGEVILLMNVYTMISQTLHFLIYKAQVDGKDLTKVVC